ncbi:hypothetical protein Tco_0721219 [Tanacetum coccineum]
MESKDMVSSCLDKDEQELQRLCEIKKEMKKKFDNIFHNFQICIHGLRPDWFHPNGEYAFQFLFGEKFHSFKKIFDHNIDQLKKQLDKEELHGRIPRHGNNSSPGKDTDAITIAKSSHDNNKTEIQWSNNELFENNHELQAKNKDLENVVCKMGKSTETLRLLTNEQRAYRDNIRKSGLGYKGPYVLSQANAKIPKLYSAYELHDENVQLHVFDSEETLEDAEKSRLK